MTNIKFLLTISRVVIKSQGPGIFPGYKESGPRLLLLENRTKREPKEIPSRLIPRLLVLFTRELEILVATLNIHTLPREMIMRVNEMITKEKMLLSVIICGYRGLKG